MAAEASTFSSASPKTLDDQSSTGEHRLPVTLAANAAPGSHRHVRDAGAERADGRWQGHLPGLLLPRALPAPGAARALRVVSDVDVLSRIF
jgi:hypothetical protein